jgi:hypothetical protein
MILQRSYHLPTEQQLTFYTDTAMTNIGYRYYYLFIICNFTNALTFYLFLPETARLPLEEMNYLFTNAPFLVPFHDKKAYQANYAADLERRAREIREKGDVVAEHQGEVIHEEEVVQQEKQSEAV